MSFNVTLYNNKSEYNKMDKDIELIAELPCTLKDRCSLDNVMLLLGGALEDFSNCNYVHIPNFKRYYFVTNIESLSNNLVVLHCKSDVLSSFKTQIRNNSAIIKRQENDFNLYYNDGSFRCYSNPKVITRKFDFSFSPNAPSYILSVAGARTAEE